MFRSSRESKILMIHGPRGAQTPELEFVIWKIKIFIEHIFFMYLQPLLDITSYPKHFTSPDILSVNPKLHNTKKRQPSDTVPIYHPPSFLLATANASFSLRRFPISFATCLYPVLTNLSSSKPVAFKNSPTTAWIPYSLSFVSSEAE